MFIVRNLPPKTLGSVLTRAAQSYQGVQKSIQNQGSVQLSETIVRVSGHSECPQDERQLNAEKTNLPTE